MLQKFYAHPSDTFTSANGAVGHRSGSSFDCLGPYAKVRNCPIEGTALRLTCYATGYADTFFSIPACTRYRGQYIGGFFTSRDDGTVFVPYTRFHERLGVPKLELWQHPAGFGYFVTVDGLQDCDIAYSQDMHIVADAAKLKYHNARVLYPHDKEHSSNYLKG